MIRTLVIDDERSNREYLISMLDKYFPNIKVVGEASSVRSGIEAIRSLGPDMVFLDIRLGDGEGFDILSEIGTIDFKLIFITAFEEYALKAIKFSALDYLLKPVVLSDLQEAIEKVETQIQRDLNVQLAEMNMNLQSVSKKRIVLRTADKLHLIPVNDIIRCEADRNYVNFYLQGGRKIVISSPMKDFEEILGEQGFFRLHKSHIVNISCIESYIKSDGGQVVLSDGTRLPVADRKKADLMALFNNFS